MGVHHLTSTDKLLTVLLNTCKDLTVKTMAKQPCKINIFYLVIIIIELLFVFVEAVFVAPRSEELGIAT